MISLFRDKSIIAIFSLVIVSLLVHLHIFFIPVHIDINLNSGVLSWLFQNYLLKLHPAALSVFYILLLMVQAIRINMILNDSKMFGKMGFTTAFAVVLLSGLFTNAYSFSPAFITNSFVIWVFVSVIKLYNNPSPKALLFNVGFIASTSVILYQPALFLIAGLLFALSILRSFKPTEWLILIIGIVAPIYLFVSGLFLADKMTLLLKLVPQFQFHFLVIKDPWFWSNVSTLFLLLIAGLFVWYPNSNRMVIQIRKNWVVMLIFFILSLIGVLIFTSKSYFPEVLCIIPMAAFVSNFFLYPQRKILINLMLIIAAVMIVYNNMQVMQMFVTASGN